MPIRDFDRSKARSKSKTKIIIGICLKTSSDPSIELNPFLIPANQYLFIEKANPRISGIVISNNPAK